jgi:hypothetical protein
MGVHELPPVPFVRETGSTTPRDSGIGADASHVRDYEVWGP